MGMYFRDMSLQARTGHNAGNDTIKIKMAGCESGAQQRADSSRLSGMELPKVRRLHPTARPTLNRVSCTNMYIMVTGTGACGEVVICGAVYVLNIVSCGLTLAPHHSSKSAPINHMICSCPKIYDGRQRTQPPLSSAASCQLPLNTPR